MLGSLPPSLSPSFSIFLWKFLRLSINIAKTEGKILSLRLNGTFSQQMLQAAVEGS